MQPTRVTPTVFAAGLVLALAVGGGVGWAGGALPKHSVGAKQLKKNAVTAKALKAGAVSGDKVADGSLTGADLAAGSVTGAQVDEGSLTFPVKPGAILLTGTDFRPRTSTYTVDTLGDGSFSTGSVNASFAAPIEVPAGAHVTGIKVYFLDNGPDDVDVYTGRFTPSTGGNTYSTFVSSSGTASFIRSVNANLLPVVAGSVQSLVVFLPPGGYLLYGAEISYA